MTEKIKQPAAPLFFIRAGFDHGTKFAFGKFLEELENGPITGFAGDWRDKKGQDGIALLNEKTRIGVVIVADHEDLDSVILLLKQELSEQEK